MFTITANPPFIFKTGELTQRPRDLHPFAITQAVQAVLNPPLENRGLGNDFSGIRRMIIINEG